MRKKGLIQILSLVLVIGFAGALYAMPTEVFLKQTGVSPSSTGSFHFGSLGNVNVLYGEYKLAIDWDKGAYNYEAISGFCVENAYSTDFDGIIYELLTPTGGYLEAAYILQQYRAGNISAQAGQIAAWEVAIDTGNYNVSSGAFKANFSNIYTSEAQTFLASLSGGLGGFTGSGFAIARNPVGSNPGTDYQDYVIHVPDASIMFLLGPALLSLGFWARRKRFNS